MLVVGGGIHGAGVLQAVAAAGYSALLLEEEAPASGTSSRSSKLIHGGLRYLESAQFGLVRESLRERATLLRIAPALVTLVPFYIPIYRTTRRRPWQIRAGLSMYALLGDLKRAARFDTVPRSAWGTLDGLRTDGLDAVFRYWDGQTDDAALVRAVLASAKKLGAATECPARFASAHRVDGGVEARYRTRQREELVRCSVLVNASGPWVNLVRELIEPRPPGMEVELVAGTHIELAGSITHGIYYTEAPIDARAVFIMPWKGRTLVGTTEAAYQGDPRAVRPTGAEVEYLSRTFAQYFPSRSRDVVDSWAGLRVLPKSTSTAFNRPRETTLVCDDERAPRVVAIYGGKLTGYRATAHKVVELLRRSLPPRTRVADTSTLALEPDSGA